MTPKVWAADFVVFGCRVRRSVRTYPYAWAALPAPTSPCPEIGFARTQELAEKQVSIRKHRGFTGPFEVVRTREETQ